VKNIAKNFYGVKTQTGTESTAINPVKMISGGLKTVMSLIITYYALNIATNGGRGLYSLYYKFSPRKKDILYNVLESYHLERHFDELVYHGFTSLEALKSLDEYEVGYYMDILNFKQKTKYGDERARFTKMLNEYDDYGEKYEKIIQPKSNEPTSSNGIKNRDRNHHS
jgi:hypothetical protein